MHRTKVRVVEDALDANNTIASANRGDFDRANVTVVNLMSAPGAGKTTLLESALNGIADEGTRVGVLEGDVQGSFDADRLSALDIPVVQLNTDNGFGGECHLDANMVRSVMRVSAKTGEGVDEFRQWLKDLPARVAAEAAHEHEHGHDHDHDHGHDHHEHEHAAT